ncbi:MAG TPA: response regulator [Bryobacteraceae bacterium]|nr:response regulator [Bryobacteraceae bacterium]
MDASTSQPAPHREGVRETILLVEDHSALLKLVKQILEDANFKVIAARNAREAMRQEAEHEGPIDLLLSDVRMRGKSGPELAEKLTERRPGMRVVLMSGYPGGVSLTQHEGWLYIQKPFGPAALVEKIRSALKEGRSTHSPMALGSSISWPT